MTLTWTNAATETMTETKDNRCSSGAADQLYSKFNSGIGLFVSCIRYDMDMEEMVGKWLYF